MMRRPPRSTRTDTLVPYTTLFRSAACTLCLAAVGLSPAAVLAQDYPSRPVKLIVPFGPGTTTDIISRVIGEALAKPLGQAVIVENRAGAGGRSEEHTSELQSLMRISYAVFCLNKKKKQQQHA